MTNFIKELAGSKRKRSFYVIISLRFNKLWFLYVTNINWQSTESTFLLDLRFFRICSKYLRLIKKGSFEYLETCQWVKLDSFLSLKLTKIFDIKNDLNVCTFYGKHLFILINAFWFNNLEQGLVWRSWKWSSQSQSGFPNDITLKFKRNARLTVYTQYCFLFDILCKK